MTNQDAHDKSRNKPGPASGEQAAAPAVAPTVPPALAKFSSQLDSDLLAEIKSVARAEGRHLQAVLDEALREFLDRRRSDAPRRHVMLALAQSLAEFDRLYRELSK